MVPWITGIAKEFVGDDGGGEIAREVCLSMNRNLFPRVCIPGIPLDKKAFTHYTSFANFLATMAKGG